MPGDECERESVWRGGHAGGIGPDGRQVGAPHVVMLKDRGQQDEGKSLHQPLPDAGALARAEWDEVLRFGHYAVCRDEPLGAELQGRFPVCVTRVQFIVVEEHHSALVNCIS